jgi:Zn-dependent alcohol dehydrogenase
MWWYWVVDPWDLEPCRLCASKGAGQIIAVEPINARREVAWKLGATMVLDTNVEKNNLVERIRELCKARQTAASRETAPGATIYSRCLADRTLPWKLSAATHFLQR